MLILATNKKQEAKTNKEKVALRNFTSELAQAFLFASFYTVFLF